MTPHVRRARALAARLIFSTGGATAAVVAAFLLVLAGIFYAVNESAAHECRRLATVSGMRTAYLGAGSGCYVEVGGRMIPVENWRGEADR